MIVQLFSWLIEKMSAYLRQDTELMLRMLVLNISALAIPKDDWIELTGFKGVCGNFKVTGNSLPVVTYHVFEKKIMEFILVKVEVKLPGKATFHASIDSKNHIDNKRHGEIVPLKPEYQRPFWDLAWNLYRYFPLPRKSEELEKHESAKKVQNENKGSRS